MTATSLPARSYPSWFADVIHYDKLPIILGPVSKLDGTELKIQLASFWRAFVNHAVAIDAVRPMCIKCYNVIDACSCSKKQARNQKIGLPEHQLLDSKDHLTSSMRSARNRVFVNALFQHLEQAWCSS